MFRKVDPYTNCLTVWVLFYYAIFFSSFFRLILMSILSSFTFPYDLFCDFLTPYLIQLKSYVELLMFEHFVCIFNVGFNKQTVEYLCGRMIHWKTVSANYQPFTFLHEIHMDVR